MKTNKDGGGLFVSIIHDSRTVKKNFAENSCCDYLFGINQRMSNLYTFRLLICVILSTCPINALKIVMTFINPYERISLPTVSSNDEVNLTLFNFTDPTATFLDQWIEVSDTVRTAGRSKAVLAPHIASNYQSAIFFYLLNPLPNGACFAGIDAYLNSWDLSEYQGISIDLHRQGNNSAFKLLFYNDCPQYTNCYSYESFFETSGAREQVYLPFSTFQPYFRGKYQPNVPPLNASDLRRVGIQVYGGVYEAKSQSGPGSLELFTISAYK
ncbi:unnamed protein product [Trichobilharzia szidati]|nr:unnamed protein product [Trichobilharzia szidati]